MVTLVKLTFLIIALLFCSHIAAEEKPDKLTPEQKWRKELYSIDHNDRFGRVKIADTRQNDEEFEYFSNSGMMCTTVEFQPYSIFHEESSTYFSMDEFNEFTQDYMGFLVTPNHVGKQTDINSLTVMSAYSIFHGNNHNQFCVRDYANYGEDVRTTMYNPMKKHFDQSNAQFDWMHVPTGKYGAKIFMGNRQSYGCINFEIGAEYTDEDYTFFATLEHYNFVDDHHSIFSFHYDAVWVERFDEKTVNVCWSDVPDWDRAHYPVYLQLLVIPKTSGSKAVTTGPKPNVDYETGTHTFKWSEDKEVVATCSDIPFTKEYSFIPYMFAGVELPYMKSSNDTIYYNQATTVWIENASTTGMQVCVAELHWNDQIKHNNEEVKIHYFVVENSVAEGQQPRQTGEGQVVFRNFDPAKTTNAETKEFTQDFTDDTNAWFNRIMGKEFGDDMRSYLVPDASNDDVYFYFNIFNHTNPEVDMKKFFDYINDNIKVEKTTDCKVERGREICTELYNYSSGDKDGDFFSKYAKAASSPQVPKQGYGGTCVYGRNEVGTCTPYTCCGYGGTQTITRKISAEQFGDAKSCEMSGVQMTSPCDTEFKVNGHKEYPVKKMEGSEWEMEYFMERWSHANEPASGSGSESGSGSGKGGEEEKEKVESRSGVSSGLFIGVVVMFVLFMITEFFVVSAYIKSKYTKTAFQVGYSKGNEFI